MIDLLFYMLGSKPTFSMTAELSSDKLNEFGIVMRAGTTIVQCDKSTPFPNKINEGLQLLQMTTTEFTI